MTKAPLFYVVILLTCFKVNCQAGLLGVSDTTTFTGPGERIRLYTDRNLYCVNESIFFTAGYSCDSEKDSIQWSKVLYVELISWNGGKLAGLKLKLDPSGSSGSLRIPGDLLSGNYYLRAYTKWMRNFSVNDYAYRLVKIVNPFQADIDPGPSETLVTREFIINPMPIEEFMQGVQCTPGKSQYRPREQAEVELDIPDDQSFGCHDFCVSVARAGSIDTSFLVVGHERKASGITWGAIEYLPEIWGNTLSGRIVDKTSNVPKKDLLVSLSEPENGSFFSAYQTRDNGRFIFSLPDLFGNYDFFIQSAESDTTLSMFLIDNSFCNRPVTLPYIAFSLNEAEKHLIRDMMVNMQLNEIYLPNPDSTKKVQPPLRRTFPFYGSVGRTYYTEKYIELPTVEDFFVEIVQEAIVVHNQGKPELKISGSTGFSNYPPLILLDNIQVHDDQLLKLPLDKIEKVQVIENGYMAGNMKYSGLISVYSKNKDMAGMDRNKNSMSFTFDLFSDANAGFSFNETSVNSRIPDRLNLLYWNPDLQLSAGQKSTISFYTPDNKGDYVVYVLGKHGSHEKQVYGKCSFSVK
jgi:hypothetical protein